MRDWPESFKCRIEQKNHRDQNGTMQISESKEKKEKKMEQWGI